MTDTKVGDIVRIEPRPLHPLQVGDWVTWGLKRSTYEIRFIDNDSDKNVLLHNAQFGYELQPLHILERAP
jgi:hypothetical protein